MKSFHFTKRLMANESSECPQMGPSAELSRFLQGDHSPLLSMQGLDQKETPENSCLYDIIGSRETGKSLMLKHISICIRSANDPCNCFEPHIQLFPISRPKNKMYGIQNRFWRLEYMKLIFRMNLLPLVLAQLRMTSPKCLPKFPKNLVQLQFSQGIRRPNQYYQKVVPRIQHPHHSQAFPR